MREDGLRRDRTRDPMEDLGQRSLAGGGGRRIVITMEAHSCTLTSFLGLIHCLDDGGNKNL
jgi:hypothetical protein